MAETMLRFFWNSNSQKDGAPVEVVVNDHRGQPQGFVGQRSPPDGYNAETDNEEKEFAIVNKEDSVLFVLDPNLNEEQLKLKCPSHDIRTVEVKRNGKIPLYTHVDTGCADFGKYLYGENQQVVWEYDSDGRVNRAYLERLRVSLEVEVPPVVCWDGYDPNLDFDLDLENVVLRQTLTRPQKGFVYVVQFDASDHGHCGPSILHPANSDREVFKYVVNDHVNPLFRQIRRSQVRWEIRFMTTGF